MLDLLNSRSALLQLYLFSIVYGQFTNGTSSPFTAKFNDLVNDTLHLWNVPGIAIAVVDSNQTWAEVSIILFINLWENRL
jgi:hypothetical protein